MSPISLGGGWDRVLAEELGAPYMHQLMTRIALGAQGPSDSAAPSFFPSPGRVFAAFAETPYDRVRAVILGQDPYHGPGQAHGLAFSVNDGVPPPPSLRNVFRELVADIGCRPPTSGDLSPWAREGVLLLNTVLTVAPNRAGSHQGMGWERFTDRVIDVVAQRTVPTVFVFWGKAAGTKRTFVPKHHHVLEAPHPSPLSAHRGFFGSKPFSTTNRLLASAGQQPINWALP